LKEFKQLAGQTLIYGMGTMVPRLLNYVILTPYFTYNLFKNSQIEFGKVTELYAYIAFLMIILTYGMETTFFRFVNSDKDDKKVFSTIFSSLIITSVIFFVLILIFTNPIANGLKYNGETVFIRLLGGILAVEAISAIPFAKLRVENKARRFATLKFVHISLNICVMLGIYNLGPTLLHNNDYLLNAEGVVSSKFIFIANLLASSIILLLLIPELKDYSIKKFDFKLVKPLLIYGLPLMVSGIAGTVNETLDRSIYKLIIKDQNVALRDLGIYGANYKIGSLLLIFIQMFRYAAEPYFFNKSKDQDSKVQYAKLMSIFTGLIVSMGLFVLLFLNVFKYFISKPYHEGLYIVPLIVLGYILYGILFNLSVWYKLSNKTHYAFIITAVGAIITILINVIYIPVYKYGASALSHVIANGVMVLITYFLGRKYYPIKYNLLRIGFYLFAATVIYLFFQKIQFQYLTLELSIKTVVLLLFVIFVAWKENLLTKKMRNEN
jgi:O-antigen/teichoic acid export membrane protein